TRNAQLLSIGAGSQGLESLRDSAGRDVPVLRLEPLLIGSIFPIHGEDRIVVTPQEVPTLLPAALKAVEDRKFDSHHGVDPIAMLRALWVDVRARQIEQGGSTLTQQLVRSYFLSSRQTLSRKVREAIMAMALDAHFTKADLMNAYINEIFLGQDGDRAIHGFGLASQFYFGKPLAELDLSEVALLVAVVRGPSYYDPRRHPERAQEPLEGAIVVTSPQSGDVIAIVGGRNVGYDGFDRALDAHRSMGSLVKPFIYLTALESGHYNAATVVQDAPIDVALAKDKHWRPENFTHQVYGPVPVVRALAESLNLATVVVGLDVGLPKVGEMLQRFGLPQPPAQVPAMLLGA